MSVDGPTTRSRPVRRVPGQRGNAGTGAAIVTPASPPPALLGRGLTAPKRKKRSRGLAPEEPDEYPEFEAAIPLEDLLKGLMLDGGESEDNLQSVFPSVVKVFTTHSSPNYSQMWSMKKQQMSTSTGFIISGYRILTNCHSVENYSQVKVRRRGDSNKYLAKVLAMGRDCDIAMLALASPEDEKKFFADVPAIDVYASKRLFPRLQERVAVVGFPVGGDNLSISSGVVSRLDMVTYVNGIHDLPAIQTDAVINPGNSGGPVFSSETRQFVGIAFQSLVAADGVGYVIPLSIVHHFLEDIHRNGKYTGFCTLAMEAQTLENPNIRKYLQLRDDQTGVMITKIEPLAPAKGIVQVGDVVLEIDGWKLGNDQTVEFPASWTTDGGMTKKNSPGPDEQIEIEEDDGWESMDAPRPRRVSKTGLSPTSKHKKRRKSFGKRSTSRSRDADVMMDSEGESIVVEEDLGPAKASPLGTTERIDASFVITQKFVGDVIPLKLYRRGQGELTVQIKVAAPNLLVDVEGSRPKPNHPCLRLPSWFVVSGFVFTTLTEEFGEQMAGDAPLEMLMMWMQGEKKEEGQEVVLCTDVLAHDSNVGYDFLTNSRLDKIQGIKIKNLKHACELIQKAIVTAKETADKPTETVIPIPEDDKSGRPPITIDSRFIRLDFAKGPVVILDALQAEKDTKEVIDEHLVPFWKSPDLD